MYQTKLRENQASFTLGIREVERAFFLSASLIQVRASIVKRGVLFPLLLLLHLITPPRLSFPLFFKILQPFSFTFSFCNLTAKSDDTVMIINTINYISFVCVCIYIIDYTSNYLIVKLHFVKYSILNLVTGKPQIDEDL